MKHFAKSFVCLVFVLCLVMAAPAWAFDDAAEQKYAAPKAEAAKEATLTTDKNADPKCEGITLTGEKFLDMFHAIAMHGDLTDVPFIEKTLETKFEVKYDKLPYDISKMLYYKRATYTTKSIVAEPISARLTFDVERDPGVEIGSIGVLGFGNGIHDCLKITTNNFENKLGGHFFVNSPIMHDGHGMPVAGTTMVGEKGLSGKDDSTIYVSYQAGTRDTGGFIDSLGISQKKKH